MRVRFAPSPTGALHLGSAFVALANAAYARATGGTLVLRIDDTDRERSTEEHALDLVRLLRWLDIGWDEGPLYQHERGDVYAEALDALRGTGSSYPCFCTEARLAQLREQQVAQGEPPRYDGRCRMLPPTEVAKSLAAGAPHVLRLALPAGRDVVVDDLLHGPVTVPAGAYGDPVLRRADGSVGYLLATVVDDAALGITHVLRGDDHLTNTARQVLLFEALGVEGDRLPRFAHLPLLRDGTGAKLSKRAPLGTLDELVDAGYLPVTVRRYLAELLGQEAVDLLAPGAAPFQLPLVGTGAPRVDRARLDSLGRQDVARLPIDELLDGVGGTFDRVAAESLVRELAGASATTVQLRGELRVVFDGPGTGDLDVILGDAAPDSATRAGFEIALAAAATWLRDLVELEEHGDLASADAAVRAQTAVREFRSIAKQNGAPLRSLLHPLRLAWTGRDSGPGLDLILAAIGPRDALGRVQRARTVLEGIPAGGGERQHG
ncbi:MAG: glutamate--tRNA(Gln) ligase / glutamyl-tRNA synthetase [Thermoleophilia bacterium]|nr:glutamate--tRNA(Gln) ligase / glutamyl-tRNA synthetase [Thermoleophilia bacterium]